MFNICVTLICYKHDVNYFKLQKHVFFSNNKWVNVNVSQAKSILMLANKKVQEIVKTPTESESSTPTMVQSPHQSCSHGPGLSMKRSLQRFLQKRKNRIQQASPYNH